MQTTIKQVSPVEYELEIEMAAADLAEETKKALRTQRARTQIKGFRPGKVPMGLVKKMFGKALAFEIADKSIQEVYQEEVLNNEEHEVLGQPKITELDYDLDGDLRAVVQFGVRPQVTLADLSDEQVDTLVKEVAEDDVEEEIERLRRDKADLVPLEGEPATEDCQVVFDLQELDPGTGTPLIGKRDADRSLLLDDPEIEENKLLQVLKEALLGAQVGDAVRFQFAHDKAHGEHEEGIAHAHHFEAHLKEIKRRTLPELDDAFVEEVTDGNIETVEAFREDLRKHLETAWERRAQDVLESNIMERMLALHPVPVPTSVVEVYLDSYLEEVKQRNEGTLPEAFPVDAYKEMRREEAERQARWMFIRDAVVKEAALEVTEEDLEAFFDDQVGDGDEEMARQMRQFYQSMPQFMDNVEQRLLSRKVFDTLADRFQLIEKDTETLEREAEERRAAEEAVVEEAVVEESANAEVEDAAETADRSAEDEDMPEETQSE